MGDAKPPRLMSLANGSVNNSKPTHPRMPRYHAPGNVLNNNYFISRSGTRAYSSGSFASNSNSSVDMGYGNGYMYNYAPQLTLDGEAELEQCLRDGKVEMAAKKKEWYPLMTDLLPTSPLWKHYIYAVLMREPGSFQRLAAHVFGNFFAQTLVKHATAPVHQQWIMTSLFENLDDLCFNRYACRVVQQIFDHFPPDTKAVLFNTILQREDVLRMTNDGNANHVIQKMIEDLPIAYWRNLLDIYLAGEGTFFNIIEDKFGCRIMQLAVDHLAIAYEDKKSHLEAKACLEPFMALMIDNCERLSSHEYANYVVQQVIKCISGYRSELIRTCLLRNLLSLSQEKYASHVVECALKCGDAQDVYLMLEELFDGYMPEPKTGRNCIDVLLYHQYGNYVVQHMLSACYENAKLPEFAIYRSRLLEWGDRLKALIDTNSSYLSRYSSGKKMLHSLDHLLK
ncbi:unnamed protein product, partial [Mesorhabditis spiculigera]